MIFKPIEYSEILINPSHIPQKPFQADLSSSKPRVYRKLTCLLKKRSTRDKLATYYEMCDKEAFHGT